MRAVKPIIDGPEMPPHLAEITLELLEDQGISRVAVLAGTGIRPALFDEDGAYITYAQYLSLVNHALALSGMPNLGLQVGSRENISSWGMLGYAIMSCATFREAVMTGLQFQQAASGMMFIRVHEQGDRFCMELESPMPLGDALPFCVEEMVAGLTSVFRDLVGEAWRPLLLRLSYAPPGYADQYQQLLSCPVEFGRERNELWIAAPDDTPMPHADPVSARICRHLVEELLDKHGAAQDIVREVQRIILRIPGRIPDMEAVAGELGMSSRSLRRQLDGHDTSFHALRDELRRQLALDYLRDSNLTLEDIAGRLGYSEVTNFRRAFKQWTGQPPSSFR